MQIVFFTFYRKSRNKLSLEPHDTYLLFRTFFSREQTIFFQSDSPLKHIIDPLPPGVSNLTYQYDLQFNRTPKTKNNPNPNKQRKQVLINKEQGKDFYGQELHQINYYYYCNNNQDRGSCSHLTTYSISIQYQVWLINMKYNYAEWLQQSAKQYILDGCSFLEKDHQWLPNQFLSKHFQTCQFSS